MTPFTLLLGHANSAANPLLYCFLSHNIRQCLWTLLRRRPPTTTTLNSDSKRLQLSDRRHFHVR